MNHAGVRLSVMLLVLLVSGCTQSSSPPVANQPVIVQPSATVPDRPTAAPSPTVTAQPAETAFATAAPTEIAAGADVTPLLGNLGDHKHPITVAHPTAQLYFDEGVVLTFGFNHAEAIRSFKDAAKLDPACAMCYWGIALALGPNINAPMEDAAVPDAYQAIQQALALAPKVGEAEQAYIQALAKRYAAEPVADRTRWIPCHA